MKTLLEKLKEKIGYHSETVVAIPVAILSLLAISLVVRMVTGVPITEDIQAVAGYAIKGVGFLILTGIGGAAKSRIFGDVDLNSCSLGRYIVDSLASCFVLLLAALTVFGATLWL